jgi:uridine phosphorylase
VREILRNSEIAGSRQTQEDVCVSAVLDKAERSRGTIQYHIKCRAGDVGEYVLLPGDPARVPLISKYLDSVKQVARNREFLVHTGEHKSIRVSVCSTGIGCPSAAIAVDELANIGANTFIRVGSTGAVDPSLKIGDLVIATAAVRNEGTTSFHLPMQFPAVPSLEVTNALIGAAQELAARLGFVFWKGLVSTDDSFYGETPQFIENLRRQGVLNLDMESAAIFILAQVRRLRAGTINAVAANLTTGDMIYEEENVRVVEGFEKESQVVLRAIELLESDG